MFTKAFYILFRGKHPAEKCVKLKFMAACIKGRVCEHTDPDEFNPVKYGVGSITPSPSFPWLTVFVCMEFKPVGIVIPQWIDGLIGTDH